MVKYVKLCALALAFVWNGGTWAQKNEERMQQNPLECVVETGVCGPASQETAEFLVPATPKARFIYYTDPICSACWAIEPYLRLFKLQYGAYLDVEYRMGGLLPGWEGFADKSNGIASPADVGSHWDEVGAHSGMSIDGDVWKKDPLSSSYPASVAYYAAYLLHPGSELNYLRRIREMVFLEQKNIAKIEVLLQAAAEMGWDTLAFRQKMETDALSYFNRDLQERTQFGVRGFPTFIFINTAGQGIRISGSVPYASYVQTLNQSLGITALPAPYTKDLVQILTQFGKLSTLEIAVLMEWEVAKTQVELELLSKARKIRKFPQKYGDFWSI